MRLTHDHIHGLKFMAVVWFWQRKLEETKCLKRRSHIAIRLILDGYAICVACWCGCQSKGWALTSCGHELSWKPVTYFDHYKILDLNKHDLIGWHLKSWTFRNLKQHKQSMVSAPQFSLTTYGSHLLQCEWQARAWKPERCACVFCTIRMSRSVSLSKEGVPAGEQGFTSIKRTVHRSFGRCFIERKHLMLWHVRPSSDGVCFHIIRSKPQTLNAKIENQILTQLTNKEQIEFGAYNPNCILLLQWIMWNFSCLTETRLV